MHCLMHTQEFEYASGPSVTAGGSVGMMGAVAQTVSHEQSMQYTCAKCTVT